MEKSTGTGVVQGTVDVELVNSVTLRSNNASQRYTALDEIDTSTCGLCKAGTGTEGW